MKSTWFASLLLTLLRYAAAAQALTGQVTDRSTGAPLAQTTVRFDGQPGGTSTDEAGRFSLPRPASGAPGKLLFSHLGYETQALAPDQLGPVVALEPLTYQIGEVRVTYISLRKLLLRKWKVAESSLDAASQRMLQKLREKDPIKADKLAAKPETMRAAVKMIRYVFHNDGTVTARALLLFGSKAAWRLDEQQRTLLITGLDGQTNPIAVRELTTDRLVLHHASGDLDVVYVPAD